MGLGPVLLNLSQVTSVDANGNFVIGSSSGMDAYKSNMLKIQKLAADTFGLKSRGNDMLSELAKLSASADADTNAETD